MANPVDFDGPPFNEVDYQPSQATSSFDTNTAHVPTKIKQKIWEGKFTELSVLLKSAREGQIQIRNGAMRLIKNQVPHLYSHWEMDIRIPHFNEHYIRKVPNQSARILKTHARHMSGRRKIRQRLVHLWQTISPTQSQTTIRPGGPSTPSSGKYMLTITIHTKPMKSPKHQHLTLLSNANNLPLTPTILLIVLLLHLHVQCRQAM